MGTYILTMFSEDDLRVPIKIHFLSRLLNPLPGVCATGMPTYKYLCQGVYFSFLLAQS